MIKTNKPKKWLELEKKVADFYRAKGARVEHDKLMSGNQIDVYAEIPLLDYSVHKLAIEAKNWGGRTGIRIVNDFSKKVNLLKDRDLIHSGTIVSATGFTRYAREAAKDQSIHLLNSTDLVSREVILLPTRSQYNNAVIKTIESGPKKLRAYITGPHFLHPEWVIQRRERRERRKSFRKALWTYIEKSLHREDQDISLIIRNHDRYIQILKPDVRKHEINDLINEMKSNLRKIFSASEPCSTIRFCCEDPGYSHTGIITDNSYFVSFRAAEQSRIEGGFEFKDLQIIKSELTIFDKIFEHHFKGQEIEIEKLEKYITSLKNLI